MSDVLLEKILPTGQSIQVRLGDLTAENVDAIVNAANEYLSHGGGVAAAIVRRGGAVIQEESDRWVAEHGQLPTGEAAVTGAGRLPCKAVIHAVGPVWQGGQAHEDELLHSAVWNSLLRAEEHSFASLALPAISSGIFGFPKPRCARIMIETVVDFLRQHSAGSLRQVRFTNIDRLTAEIFADGLRAFKLE